jgi:hypothetical protein
VSKEEAKGKRATMNANLSVSTGLLKNLVRNAKLVGFSVEAKIKCTVRERETRTGMRTLLYYALSSECRLRRRARI